MNASKLAISAAHSNNSNKNKQTTISNVSPVAMGSNNGLSNMNKAFIANNNYESNYNLNANRSLKSLVENSSAIVAPEPQPAASVANLPKNNSRKANKLNKPKSLLQKSNFAFGLMDFNNSADYNSSYPSTANTSFASVENTSPYEAYWITHPGSSMPRPIIRKPHVATKKGYARRSSSRRSTRRSRASRRAH
jgi:hypothetical protein